MTDFRIMKPRDRARKDRRLRIGPAGLAALALLMLPPGSGRAVAPDSSPQTPRDTAAAGPTLENILKELAVYDHSQGIGPAAALREHILARADSPAEREACEKSLAAFLDSDASIAGKASVCRMLRLIGSDRSVPPLARMLVRGETNDMARFALEAIPGAAAGRALTDALDRSQGTDKIGIISSLGRRKSEEAVPLLGGIIGGPDKDAAGAAIIALGHIGGKQSAEILVPLLSKAESEKRERAASALLLCAEGFLLEKKTAEASAVYEKVLEGKLPLVIRQAAMKGRLSAAGRNAAELILAVLNGRDRDMFAPAIAAIPDAFKGPAVVPVCGLLPGLPASSRVQLVAVLADCPEAAVRAAIVKAAGDPAVEVRTEAIRALERTGDASCVPLLAWRAAKSRGAEQAAARRSLWRARGAAVDAAVMKALASADDKDVKSELIQAAGQRRIDGIKPLFMARMLQEPASSRLQMIKTLRPVVAPADLRGLLGLLLQLEDETEQEEMQAVVAAAALRIDRPLARANAVERLYAAGDDAKTKSRLIRVMGKIGDDSSLPVVREALRSPDPVLMDASARALAEWPTLTARDDVLDIARASPNDVHRVLALRAFVRMVEEDRFRSPRASVADLKEAIELAARPEEKILVLGTLPAFACEDALRLAESLLNSEEVKAEAGAAAEMIKEKLEKR